MRRIGALISFGANDPEAQSRVAAFENGLRQLGWVRGHNLSIEYRWADNSDVLRTYATELVGMAPDLILVNSTPAIAALHEQRQAVPIVLHLEAEGPDVFHHACMLGLEGIVSKRKDSQYRSGRSPHWIKSKNPNAPAVKREAEEDWGQCRG
jgi:hypothetical protein